MSLWREQKKRWLCATDFPCIVGGNPEGTVPTGEAQLRKVDSGKLIEDFIAAARWVKSRPDCTGQIAVLGFCYGGNVANTLAVRMPDLNVAVPYYLGHVSLGRVRVMADEFMRNVKNVIEGAQTAGNIPESYRSKFGQNRILVLEKFYHQRIQYLLDR